MSKDNIMFIDINRLLVNIDNPRFDKAKTETDAITNIVKGNPDKLIRLAKDILEKGLNPTDLPLVTPNPERKNYFTVEEGNRRITAVKLMLNPELIVHDKKLHLKFKQLNSQINLKDFEHIRCVVSDNEDEYNHWIELKHTGENDGVGTVTWDAKQKRKFEQERLGKTSAVLQLMDFIKRIDIGNLNIKNIHTTNISRLIGDPDVRKFLGLKLEQQVLKTNIPVEELKKGLEKILTDLSMGTIKVTDIYLKQDRAAYLSTFNESEIPDTTRVFDKYIPLNSLPTSSTTPHKNILKTVEQGNLIFQRNPPTQFNTKPTDTKSIINNYPNHLNSDNSKISENAATEHSPNNLNPVHNNNPILNHETLNQVIVDTNQSTVASNQSQDNQNQINENRGKTIPLSNRRKTLIPKEVKLQIDVKRINYIYKELQTLNVDEFPNCAAVLFRVFFELSIDSYIDKQKIQGCNFNTKLIEKVRKVADYMKTNTILNRDELKPVFTSISSQDYLGSTNTLNAYVHNSHILPLSNDLKVTWDNMDNFIKALWN